MSQAEKRESAQVVAGERPDASQADDRKYTQTEIDRVIKTHLAKHRSQRTQELRDLEQRYEDLLAVHSVGQVEKGKLKASLDELNAELEKVGVEERRELEDSHKAAVAEVKAKAQHWETRYKSFLVSNALADAAKKHGAVNADQLTAILKDDIKVVESDDGEWKPVVTLRDGNSTAELAIDDAVARMSRQPERYGNLFASGAASGIGGTSIPSSAMSGAAGTLTPQQAARLPADTYFRIRSGHQRHLMMPWSKR